MNRLAKKIYKKTTTSTTSKLIAGLVLVLGGMWAVFALMIVLGNIFSQEYTPQSISNVANVLTQQEKVQEPKYEPLDTEDYDRRMLALANYASTTSSTTTRLWPVKAPYPNDGAILPFKRIIAYYGNLYSTKMGALGEYPEDEMLSRLKAEVQKWEAADPTTPVVPALHYIVVTAQGSAGVDGKYRLRMPDSQIDIILEMAQKVNGIVFLDFQVGLSNLQSELPVYEKYLKMPNVHLGIDPEFSMKTGDKPGSVIGTFNASDINYAKNYLAKLVKENNLPPKVLVVHRFTQRMVTGYSEVKPIPEVQIVMHMDGWGLGARKVNTYKQFVYPEPIQFTGFKLFYKNDLKEPGSRLMTPEELLKLTPRPSYIQYQ